MNNVLYLPMLGLVTLTVVVWAMAVYRRVREIRIRRIPLQSLAQARQVAVAFEDVQAMDNFNNLLQVPVLFYVLCLAVAQSGSGGELFLARLRGGNQQGREADHDQGSIFHGFFLSGGIPLLAEQT